MNIYNFKEYINSTILERGYDYYLGGSVVDVHIQSDHEYVFQVQGSDEYEVLVETDGKEEILDSSCDCPYDFGPICKHEAAAYFKLFEILNDNSKNIKSKKKQAKNPSVNEILNNLPKEELVSIIIEITKEDSTFKNSLIVRYSNENDEQVIVQCKRLINSLIRKHTGREGFIKYRDVYSFAGEMEHLVLEKARNTSDQLLALDIALLVLEEAVNAFQYADDSGGDIGSLVTETIGLIDEIAINSAELSMETREKIFYRLLRQSDSNVFDGWDDFRLDILNICTEFADTKALRDQLQAKIEYMIDGNSEDWYRKYSNEKMLEILFELIERYGSKDEAEEFIKSNLKYSSFRKKLIEKSIKENNHQQVIDLALEGEKKDKQYPGLVDSWKQIRYDAYRNLSLKDEQEKLAKELFLGGKFIYYHDMKALALGDKSKFYNSLKEELKNSKGWYARSLYLELIKTENDINEMLDYVRGNPNAIEEYAKLLLSDFHDEVVEVYKMYIKSSSKSSSNRREYKQVCGILQRYKKIAGHELQDEMINELRESYSNRPAFLDELGKIKMKKK